MLVCDQIAGLGYDVSVGIGANVSTVGLAVLIRFGFSQFWDVRRKRFFGVQKRRRLNVYYGCIPVGANLVGAVESQEAKRFAELFQHRVPGLGDRDSLLNQIFLAGVKVTGIPSCSGTPVNLEESLITLGSPMYTFASGVFERTLEPRVSFRGDAIHCPHGEVQDHAEAILVKKCRAGLAYFYAAGFDEAGTLAASRYLTDNWQELARKYPNQQSFFLRVRLSRELDEVALVAECRLD